MSDSLNAARDHVVSFHYDLADESGSTVETSRSGEPSLALLGHGNLMRGLESAIEGHTAGERFQVSLTPEQGFGMRRDDWTQRVSKKHFASNTRFEPGAELRLNTDQGTRTVTVLKVGGKFVDVDLNHPLAGQTVVFDVEILAVRRATGEELAHRHAHGVGGHHH